MMLKSKTTSYLSHGLGRLGMGLWFLKQSFDYTVFWLQSRFSTDVYLTESKPEPLVVYNAAPSSVKDLILEACNLKPEDLITYSGIEEHAACVEKTYHDAVDGAVSGLLIPFTIIGIFSASLLPKSFSYLCMAYREAVNGPNKVLQDKDFAHLRQGPPLKSSETIDPSPK